MKTQAPATADTLPVVVFGAADSWSRPMHGISGSRAELRRTRYARSPSPLAMHLLLACPLNALFMHHGHGGHGGHDDCVPWLQSTERGP